MMLPTTDCELQSTCVCPLTKFEGSLKLFHELEDNTYHWPETAVFGLLLFPAGL